MIIRQLTLKAGRTIDASAETILATPVIVFVGPNNSGKSKVLSEIYNFCRVGHSAGQALILDKLDFNKLSQPMAEYEVNKLLRKPNVGEIIPQGHETLSTSRGRVHIPKNEFIRSLVEYPLNTDFFSWWLGTYTLMLGGLTRISLMDEQPSGDLQSEPQNVFQTLFADDTKRQAVRDIIYNAFGQYFVIDPTKMGFLRARLSSRPPKDDCEERGFHAAAVDFHKNSMQIQESSDGVKAFAGIVTQIQAGDPKVVTIDEPEAFLHPSLASKLGTEIARLAAGSGKNVFVSTHSPQFLMGCVQAATALTIIRLTYSGGVGTSRILSSDEIVRLMRNPLLRSTGVISGLFYEAVVVTESDSDRAFYQEVNERLLRSGSNLGINNCLFLNAQNKTTVKTIIEPLRKMGIPTAGIVDIDILKNGGADWTNLLRSMHMPPITHAPLGQLRTAIRGEIDSTGKDMKRGGIELLNADNREAAQSLLDQLADYGLFVVAGGELESWLKSLGAKGHGPTWLIDIFQKMGEDPLLTDYVNPQDGDVWAFISKVKSWLINPSRKGVPS